MMSDIIKKLKAKLLEKGISRCNVSELTGIKYELVRRILAGERKLSIEEFLLIIEKCGIDIEELI